MGLIRRRLMVVIYVYRASIEGGRFDEVDRDLRRRRWFEDEEITPVVASIQDKATEFFDELHEAVANRDREAALASIERIRRSLQNIGV